MFKNAIALVSGRVAYWILTKGKIEVYPTAICQARLYLNKFILKNFFR